MDKSKHWIKLFLLSALIQLYSLYLDQFDLLTNLSSGERFFNYFFSRYLTPLVFSIALFTYLINFISGKWK